MSARRVAVVVAALAGLVVSPLGTPAARAEAPQGGISNPAEGRVLTTMTPTISGEYRQPRVAGQAGKVDEVVVQLTGLAAQPIPGGGTFRQAGGGEAVSFSWVTPRLTYNGPYEARAQARGTDGFDTDGQEVSAPSIRRFSLRVPPAVPGGFKAVIEGGSTVLTSWTANREPDLVGYQVQRAPQGSTRFEEVGQTADTSYRDTAPSPGDWSYRVVAVRAGANEDELVASNPTNASAVTVTAPPPSTTPDGSPASGDGSGSGSGSGTGTGAGSGSTAGSGGSGGRAIATAGKVDLSGFASLLDSNRRPVVRPTEPDPGFGERLPFQAPTDELGTEDQEEELGADDPEADPSLGLGQTPISVLDDDGERRRSISFLAGGLLAFVMMMQVLWLKGQVDRAPDDLESLDAPPA
jgi:hypothetical protein